MIFQRKWRIEQYKHIFVISFLLMIPIKHQISVLLSKLTVCCNNHHVQVIVHKNTFFSDLYTH